MEPEVSKNEILTALKELKSGQDGLISDVASLKKGQEETLEAVNDGFQEMEERFDGRFKKNDGRFDKLENKIDGLDRRMDKLEGRNSELVNVLHQKGALTPQEKERVLS